MSLARITEDDEYPVDTAWICECCKMEEDRERKEQEAWAEKKMLEGSIGWGTDTTSFLSDRADRVRNLQPPTLVASEFFDGGRVGLNEDMEFPSIIELEALLEELIGPFYKWPDLVKPFFFGPNPVIKKEIHYQDRFRITKFLLVNGISPDQVLEWFEEKCEDFTHGKRKHVESIIAEYKPGCKWGAWNVSQGRYM